MRALFLYIFISISAWANAQMACDFAYQSHHETFSLIRAEDKSYFDLLKPELLRLLKVYEKQDSAAGGTYFVGFNLIRDSFTPEKNYFRKIYELEKFLTDHAGEPAENHVAKFRELAYMYLRGNQPQYAINALVRGGDWLLATKVKEILKMNFEPFTQRQWRNSLRVEKPQPTWLKERLEDSFENMLGESETRAGQLVASEKPAEQVEGRRLYAELAKIYNSNQRYQEAIWSLRSAGQHEQAAQLTQIFKDLLLRGEIKEQEEKLGGVTGAKLVDFGSGVKAIAKKQSSWLKGSQKPEDEVLAYEIANYLGLNYVPITVLRDWNWERVSVQMFVHNYRGNHDTPWFKSSRREDDNMVLFDYLIVNQDRYNGMGAHNRLFRNGKNQVLIDHGMIFRPYPIARRIFPALNQNKDVTKEVDWDGSMSNPDTDFIATLRKLDESEENAKFREMFLKYGSESQFRMFEDRRRRALRFYAEIDP